MDHRTAIAAEVKTPPVRWADDAVTPDPPRELSVIAARPTAPVSAWILAGVVLAVMVVLLLLA